MRCTTIVATALLAFGSAAAAAAAEGVVTCRAETRHDRRRNILIGNRVRCR